MSEPYTSPPHCIDSEESVLGAMLISSEAAAEALAMLRREDFYREQHRTIYESVRRLHEAGTPADPMTVADDLARRGLLDSAGERPYLITLVDSCPSHHNIRHYAQIVRDLSIRRDLIEAGHEVVGLGHTRSGDLPEQIAAAEARLYAVGERLKGSAASSHVSVALDESLRRMLNARKVGSRVTGLRTGFASLDGYTCGLQPSNLIVIGGRTSMGKTSLALNIAANAALSEDTGVLFFSLEMSKREVGDRLIQAHAYLDSSLYRSGDLSEDQLVRAHEARRTLALGGLIVDDDAEITPAAIRHRARRRASSDGIGLIIVDYIQLMHIPGFKEGRVLEVARIARDLKVMAMELGVPVIAVSQLRRPQQGARREPMLEDLRESGGIEQAADVVLLLYRPELDATDRSKRLELAGVADVAVAKHRNGRTGKCRLIWVGPYSSFYDQADDRLYDPDAAGQAHMSGGPHSGPAAPDPQEAML